MAAPSGVCSCTRWSIVIRDPELGPRCLKCGRPGRSPVRADRTAIAPATRSRMWGASSAPRRGSAAPPARRSHTVRLQADPVDAILADVVAGFRAQPGHSQLPRPQRASAVKPTNGRRTAQRLTAQPA